MIPKLTLGALAVVLLAQHVRTSLDATRVQQHVRVGDLDPNSPADIPLLTLLARAGGAVASGAFRVKALAGELIFWRSISE